MKSAGRGNKQTPSQQIYDFYSRLKENQLSLQAALEYLAVSGPLFGVPKVPRLSQEHIPAALLIAGKGAAYYGALCLWRVARDNTGLLKLASMLRMPALRTHISMRSDFSEIQIYESVFGENDQQSSFILNADNLTELLDSVAENFEHTHQCDESRALDELRHKRLAHFEPNVQINVRFVKCYVGLAQQIAAQFKTLVAILPQCREDVEERVVGAVDCPLTSQFEEWNKNAVDDWLSIL